MLIDIPLEDTSNFVNILKKELPQSLFIINFIETCHKWRKLNGQLQVSLLYTECSIETGVFIGVLKSGCRGVLVVMYAFDSHEDDLEQALKYIQLDWKTVVNFEGISKKHGPIVEKLITAQCLNVKNIYPLVMFSMPKDVALNMDIQCPDNVSISSLNEYHAKEMYEIWIGNDLYTIDALKNAIKYNQESACGIFCKESGKLLARCVRSHSGVVSALQTIETAKNKGYAKLLLRYVAKKMAENDILPCSYTAEINLGSMKVHRSIGFEDVSQLINFNMQCNINEGKNLEFDSRRQKFNASQIMMETKTVC